MPSFDLPPRRFVIVKKGTTIIDSRYYSNETLFDDMENSDPHYEVPSSFDLATVAVRFDSEGKLEFFIDTTLYEAQREQALTDVRKERNRLLSMSDWTRLDDVTMSPEKKQEWTVYRQKLRDFPSSCDPFNPQWPVRPA